VGALVLVGLAWGLTTLSVAAWGQAASAPSEPTAGPAPTAEVPMDGGWPMRPATAAPSRDYLAICALGNAKYAARNRAGAEESYKLAIAQQPNQPLGHYLLGEAELASDDREGAQAEETLAASLAGERDPALHARALFVLATIQERQKRWDGARAAWQMLLDWAGRFPSANGAAASARSRIEAIDAMRKQDAAYEGVRRRIAETQDGGVFTDPTKAPPAK
jgi:tetratricopeptide (TPR) repeat protein